MEIVRIGVIGAGVMGEWHCRVCANLPRVELVGVADPNEEGGRQVAESYARVKNDFDKTIWAYPKF